MGRIFAIIPDDLENEFRMKVVVKYGGKKGDMSIAFTDAVRQWVDED